MSERPHVRLRMLGAFACTSDGFDVSVPGRLRSLLAVLGTAADEPVSFERLTAGVWGEDPPAEPRRALQVYVNRLRTRLGADAITTHSSGYRLEVGGGDVDVRQFRLLAARAAASTDSVERLRLIDDALGLWHGDPFEAVAAAPLEEVEAPRLVEQRLRLIEQRFDLLMDRGREAAEPLIAEMDDLVRRHPLRETLWERLLTALDAADRGAEALERYAEVRALLSDELGADPGRGLQLLYARLLEGEVVTTVPRQLLPDLPLFTGRESALAKLDDLLLGGGARTPVAVALTGIGGTGKTALATHWAHRNHEQFPDGQLYVDLHGFSSQTPLEPSAALETVLRGLGLTPEVLPAGLNERSALLRTTLSGRRTLLVLDNARDAEQVRPLLPGGSVCVIITSRNQLRGLTAREGVHAVALEPLEFAEATDLLSSIVGHERVSQEPDSAREVAELCGRLPLAVAITAERVVRVSSVPLSEVAATLRDEAQRLAQLTVGDDEHSDLRAVFELSYALLDPESARLFRLLSLLPDGPFEISAVAALTGLDRTRAAEVLDSLAANHLVQQSGPTRFWLHDLLRVYASEQCAKRDGAVPAEAAVASAAHWLLGCLQAASTAVRPGQPELPAPKMPAAFHRVVEPFTFDGFADAIEWFRRERTSLIGWIDRIAEHGLHDHVWRLGVPLSLLMEITEHRTDAASLATLGRESVSHVDDPRATYAAQDCAGRAYVRTRRLDDADAALTIALGAAREAGHGRAEAAILCSLGIVRRMVGDTHESLRILQNALDCIGEPDGSLLEASESSVRVNIATAYYMLHSFDDAISATWAALQCAREAGDQWREATCLNNLTVMLELTCEYSAATDTFFEGERLCEQIGAPALVFDAHTARGRMLVVRGDRAGAQRAWEQALTLLPATDNPRRLEVLRLLERVRSPA